MFFKLIICFTFVFGLVAQVNKDSKIAQIGGKALGEQIRIFEESAQIDRAIALVKYGINNEKLDRNTGYFILSRLFLKQKNYNKFFKFLKLVNKEVFLNNLAFVRDFYFKLPKSKRKNFIKLVSKNKFFTPKEWSECPYFELEKRRERAEFLYLLSGEINISKKTSIKILHELFVSIPEVINLEKLVNLKYFEFFREKLAKKDFSTRMSNLMLFGQNQEAIKTYNLAMQDKKKITSVEYCELNYQRAKTARRQKKYNEAKSRFDNLILSCEGEIKRKARYMRLKLASMLGEKRVLGAWEFDKFVGDYPTHGFSDDVLLFKALLLFDLGKKEAARKTLERIYQTYPQGDMIYRALFLWAFSLAQDKKISEALKILDILEHKSLSGSQEEAQARYWQARLKLVPELNNLAKLKSLKKNKKINQTVINNLKNLAQSDFPTVYSFLSYILLRNLNILVKLQPAQNLTNKKSKPENLSLAVKSAQILVENKFNRAAKNILREYRPESISDVLKTAELIIKLGDPLLGHHILTRCRSDFRQELKKYAATNYYLISYPEIFKQDIRFVQKHFDIPQSFILAITREESGFISSARSWAGAKGLMQLVFLSAQEQAKKLGIKNLEPINLFEPKTNLLLGTSLLNSYWQRFGHIAVALAAYNGGPGNARKWVKNSSNSLDVFLEKIPFLETQRYIKSVLASIFIYEKKSAAGFMNRIGLEIKNN